MGILANTMVGDLHVSASDRECIRHVLKKMLPDKRFSRKYRTERHITLRQCLEAHHRNRELVETHRLEVPPPEPELPDPPVIRTHYRVENEKGLLAYHSQKTFGDVEQQIKNVLQSVVFNGDNALENLEWIAGYRHGRIAKDSEPFPKGEPFVSVSQGNNEGWVISVYVAHREDFVNPPKIRLAMAIKYLCCRDLVYEAGKALSIALDMGQYGYDAPPKRE